MRLPFALRSLFAICVLAGASGRAADVVSISELDRVPARIVRDPPKYPAALAAEALRVEVSLDLIVDVEGKVKGVENVKAPRREFVDATTAAVRKWVFARGFANGRPASFRVPITIAFRPGVPGELDVEEVATKAYGELPVYPEALKTQPRDGEVMVDVQIDSAGVASDAVVEFASHPAFAEPARAAVLGWNYTPAQRAGVVVTARTRLLVQFKSDDAALTPEKRTFKEQMAHLRDYDVSPKPVRKAPLIYPLDALLKNEGGGATLGVLVGPEGGVVRCEVAMATQPEFGVAARACLSAWRFEPGSRVGHPVFAHIQVQFSFAESDEAFQFDETTTELIAALRAGNAAFPGMKQLDAIPKVVQQVNPVLPPEIEGEATAGEAVIEVIIDRTGRVQLPRVVRATSPEIGYAAATALTQWRFEPPLKGGSAVDARVRVPLRFKARPAGESQGALSAPAAPAPAPGG